MFVLVLLGIIVLFGILLILAAIGGYLKELLVIQTRIQSALTNRRF